jgi:hypothetical protein
MTDEPTSLRDDDEAPAGETYQQRVNRRMRQEIAEADQDWIRKQKLLDLLWQQRLDAEAPLDDDMIEVAGFRVPRYRTSCHVGRHDPDFGQH